MNLDLLSMTTDDNLIDCFEDEAPNTKGKLS